MTKTFDPPPIARLHCRHYHYDRGTNFMDGGPRCAVGVDLSDGGSTRKCMPSSDDGRPLPTCAKREEWTEAERGAWEAYQHERMGRLVAALGSLPRPIPMRSGGEIPCPSCDGGNIRYDRWYRGASLVCSTSHCCAAQFNIKDPTDWPAAKDDDL